MLLPLGEQKMGLVQVVPMAHRQLCSYWTAVDWHVEFTTAACERASRRSTSST